MDAFLEQAVTFPASVFPDQHTPFDVLQEFCSGIEPTGVRHLLCVTHQLRNRSQKQKKHLVPFKEPGRKDDLHVAGFVCHVVRQRGGVMGDELEEALSCSWKDHPLSVWQGRGDLQSRE